MQDSIFTKIIKGEVPCHKVYEDDKTIAFLDIHPVQPGHTLVVFKQQIEQFTDMNQDDFSAYMSTVQKIARHLQQKLTAQRIVLRFEGFDVPHVHAHLIPCEKEGDSYRSGRENEEPDHVALAAVTQELLMKDEA